MRTVRLLISVAGPAMNLLLGLVSALVFVVAARMHAAYPAGIALYFLQLNFGLMFFNLLPVPPLDGRSFLAFLPDSLAVVRDGLMRYGGFIFLALIFLGGIGNGPGPLSYIMWPFNWLTAAFISVLKGLAGVG
jgi:Zn-dependent protease